GIDVFDVLGLEEGDHFEDRAQALSARRVHLRAKLGGPQDGPARDGQHDESCEQQPPGLRQIGSPTPAKRMKAHAARYINTMRATSIITQAAPGGNQRPRLGEPARSPGVTPASRLRTS